MNTRSFSPGLDARIVDSEDEAFEFNGRSSWPSTPNNHVPRVLVPHQESHSVYMMSLLRSKKHLKSALLRTYSPGLSVEPLGKPVEMKRRPQRKTMSISGLCDLTNLEDNSIRLRVPLRGFPRIEEAKQFPTNFSTTISNTPKNVVDTVDSWVANHPYRHLIFQKGTICESTFRQYVQFVHRGMKYNVRVKEPSSEYREGMQVELQVLAENKKDKILFLDLDETLIYQCKRGEKPDLVATIFESGERRDDIYVKTRPFLSKFLNEMSKLYIIVIFSAASPKYIQAIVDAIDPGHKWISSFLSREQCHLTKTKQTIKDLCVVKDLDLAKCVIVDNLPHVFALQVANGIPILEFKGNPLDQELKYLGEYLRELEKTDDVREFNTKHLKLLEMVPLAEKDLY